jgi:hypothetical protein
MFTWGSKYLFGISVLGFIGAFAYGLVSGGGPVGVISMGYKGGVGEHLGYAILLSVGFGAAILGVLSVIYRDGDAEEMSERAGAEHILAVRPPSSLSISPPLAGFAIACLVMGLAVSQLFLYLGLSLVLIAAVQWSLQAWSDNATGDPETNSVIRNRILGPFEVPVLSVVSVAVVVIAISRAMLAVSKLGSVVVVVVAACFVFFGAVLIAKSKAPRPIVSAIVTLGAVALLAGGVVGAAAGPRDFHHGDGHGGEHGDDHSDAEAGEEGE